LTIFARPDTYFLIYIFLLPSKLNLCFSRFVDQIGRKAGTLAFAALYAAGALSTQSALLPLLLLGRVAGGLGTSLLFSGTHRADTLISFNELFSGSL
jgi:MFS family permease